MQIPLGAVINSDVGYLGYQAAEAYGISYKVSFFPYDDDDDDVTVMCTVPYRTAPHPWKEGKYGRLSKRLAERLVLLPNDFDHVLCPNLSMG